MEKDVLLGFVDKEVETSQILSWKDNKIGGNPVWPTDLMANENVKCELCGGNLALVTQINCPLGQSIYHRIFYLFCCINSTCWNKRQSWRVIRCQIKDEAFLPTETPLKADLSSDTWLADADTWSNDSEDLISSNMSNISLPFTPITIPTQINDQEEEMDENDSNVIPETIKINPDIGRTLPIWLNKSAGTESVPGVIGGTSKPVFKPFYLSVCEEPGNEKHETSEHVQHLMSNYEMMSGNPFYNVEPKDATNCKESYEKSEIKHGDKDFYKFCKRVNRSPTQVIRYCWDGKPLLITNGSQLTMLCDYCGSNKVFEFQLMPTLIAHLQLLNATDKSNVCVEFGTVSVFSCQKSCWQEESTLKYETVFVEADPYEVIFNMK